MNLAANNIFNKDFHMMIAQCELPFDLEELIEPSSEIEPYIRVNYTSQNSKCDNELKLCNHLDQLHELEFIEETRNFTEELDNHTSISDNTPMHPKE